ncbi:MAG: triose-phosphate isomerase [Elusimicrobia bacterium]|nr:triose-phosphate isomerase [Elusimicrobiota bacterium]
MRKPLLAANWKMNKTLEEVREFAQEFKRKLPHGTIGHVDIVICPVFVHITALSLDHLLPAGIAVGAQDGHWEDKGAFTGCVSPAMLKDLKARYVIIGHSERRQYFHETNEMLTKKLLAALKAGLIPIFCVGERLQEREEGRTFKVLEEQMSVLRDVPAELVPDPSSFVLAYEPVWAIGTGKNAAPEQAQEVHHFLRETARRHWGAERAEGMRLLYGGSVTPENFSSLANGPDVDGGLVGGASLDSQKFLRLIEILTGK